MNQELIDHIKQNKERGFSFKYLLIGIAIIVIIGLMGWGIYSYIKEHHQLVETTEKEEKENGEKEIVPENWTTYTNTEYGYQIDYPVSWVLYDQPYEKLEWADFDSVVLQTFSVEEVEKMETKETSLMEWRDRCWAHENCLYVIIEINSDFLSLEEWTNKWKNGFEKAREQGFDWNIEEGEIAIGGRKGYEFMAWIPDSSTILATHKVAIFEKGKLYCIRADGLQKALLIKFPETFQRIISSFKFIEI